MKTYLVFALSLATLSSAAAGAPAAKCTLDRATGTTIDPRPFLENAYNTRWNAVANRIAFMAPGTNGYYRVYTMRPDGSDRQPLTEGRPGLPQKHQGAVYWRPDGKYLLFIAQKEEWSGRKLFGIPDYGALPGFGRHDDLWLIAADGSRSWRLTAEGNTDDEGELIPVFSPDGEKIAWASRQPGGKYLLKIADFALTPEPHLKNIRSYQPGGGRYFEPGAFSSDGKSLTYSSDQDTHSFWRSQIYRLDLASGESQRLTTGNDYNEHPTVVKTPSGDWIVYMSTRDVERRPLHLLLGTDWYAMRLDGGGAKRLTTMNVNDKNNPQNAGVALVAGTVSVSPAGDSMLGDVQDSLVKQTGLVKVVRFVCEP